MSGRKLIRRFYCAFAVITFLLSLTSCNNKLPLIEAIFDESYRQPAQYIYLASAKISTSREIEVKATACRGFSHVAISESSTAPVADSAFWQACVNGDTTYTYQFNSSAVGPKTVFFHTRLGSVISPVTKKISITYAPKVVIGADTENDIPSLKRSLYTPNGINTTGSDLWISDYQNNRILKFNTVPTTHAPLADFVLGQPGLTTYTSNYGGVSGYSLFQPLDTYIYENKLFVSDYANNRVLIWNTIPATYNTPADVVLGQPNFSFVAPSSIANASTLKNPRGIHVNAGKLFVADGGNNRVLVWNTIPTTNGQPADVVLGQPTMASATASSANFNIPGSITTAGTKLFITDYNNDRVLVWNTIPTTNYQPADFALGQTAVASNTANAGGLNADSLNNPYRITASGTKLAVSDYNNHRVLIWNTIPTSMKQPADIVLGQPNFTTNTLNYGGMSAYSLNSPRDIAFIGNKLAVADGGNNRVLIWNTVPTANYTPADVVIGQSDFISTNNHHTPYTGARAVQGINMYTDGQRIVVSDILLNRVLIWNSIPTSNNQPADLVIGQSNFTSGLPNRGASAPTAATLNGVTNSIVVGNKLVVNDRSNHRILIWNTMPTTNGQAADVVLGQATFTTMTSGVSSSKLFSPSKIYSDGTKVFVPDEQNNRVLIWNTIPTVSNTPADLVLGQSGFTQATANGGGTLNASGVYLPYTAMPYNNKLFVADQNHRISVWNSIPNSNNTAADYVLGQSNFSTSGAATTTDEMKKVGVIRALYAYDNKLYSMALNQGYIKIWNSIPTSNFKSADMTYGYSYVRQQTVAPATIDELSFQESVADIYTDNYRFIISDRNRILISPYPNVLLSQAPEGRGGQLDLAARSCEDISEVLFNEGGKPDADDSDWQDCSTEMDSLHYTINSGSQGRRNIKVWYKDIDGHVLPAEQGVIPYIYDLSPPIAPSVALSTPTTTNSLSGQLTVFGGCSDFVEEYVSPALVPPTAASNWTACATTAGSINYSIPEPAADGPHNLYLWSRDLAGNISASPTVIVVTIDRTPPASVPALVMQRKHLATISQFRFAPVHCNDVNALFISETDTAPLASDANWQTCSTAQNSLMYTATQLTDSIHNFRIWAKDLYGNVLQTPRYYSYTPAGVPTILGQINALTNFNAAAGMFFPSSVHSDGTKLVVADNGNHRVLIWNSIPTTMQTPADVVLGQDTMYGVAPNQGLLNPTASTLHTPQDAKIFGTKLVVADYNNNRVLIWNTIPTTNGQAADIVLGQADFNSKTINSGGVTPKTLYGPTGIAYNGTQFFVADRQNNRVLIWSSFPTASNQTPNIVLGQVDFNSNAANSGGISSSSLSSPFSIETIGASQVFIADESNNRILSWNTVPSTNNQAADFVLGQTSFTAGGSGTSSGTFDAPRRLAYDGAKLYLADTSNNRVLIWNSLPTTTGQTADVVVGQSSMSSNSATVAADRLDKPQGVFAQGTKLFVADRENHRVVVWNTIPVSHGASANYALGQNSITGSTANIRPASAVAGYYFKGALHGYSDSSYSVVTDYVNSRVLIWNSNTVSGTANVVVGQTNMVSSTAAVSQTGLNNPRVSIIVGTKLIISDYDNNRIMIWNTIPTSNGQNADVVLGQSVFTTNTQNNGGISSATLANPYELASDGTRLIVADRTNNRVLIWNTIPTTNKTPANIVLGQPNFTTNTANNGGRTGATMNTPVGVSTDGTRLLVTDYANHRVLIWNNLAGISTGQAADIVVGQPDFVTAIGSASLNRHRNPHTAMIYGGKLYVSDRGNNRVLIYDTVPVTNGADASHMIGQTITGGNNTNQNGLSGWSFSTPAGLYFNNGLLHIVDAGNDRVIAINPGL